MRIIRHLYEIGTGDFPLLVYSDGEARSKELVAILDRAAIPYEVRGFDDAANAARILTAWAYQGRACPVVLTSGNDGMVPQEEIEKFVRE
ncbi:MAG: hypothetical protein GF400_09685 [Candidatus Eisenbacteria bacterium]|nr:hypothetical protein [Candidatus Eisenbacteria bacterium]